MKNLIIAFVLCVCMLCSTAFAETDYVNITSLSSVVPERFQGEFTTKSGDKIHIDAPVIIPNVTSVPIIRVTWGGPMEITDPSLNIAVNDANLLQVDHGFVASPSRVLTDDFETVNDQLTHMDAEKTLLDKICSIMPSLQPQDFECINRLSYRLENTNSGFYMLFFARLYHGIPYLCNAPYAIPLENAEPALPNEITHGCIEDKDHFTLSISSPKEIGIIEEDVPLLPFSEIESILSQRIENGYIKRLDEIRFGYRIFIDPDQPGSEYILVPVWVFAGSMRALTDIPFVKEEVVFMPYKNMSSFAINAQTGEVYTFATEKSENRNIAPNILAWN